MKRVLSVVVLFFVSFAFGCQSSATPAAADAPINTMCPIADEMLTMQPPSAFSMWGIAWAERWRAVVTLKRNAWSNASSLCWSIGVGGEPPALFTTMSILPSSVTVRSTSASSWSKCITSVGMTSTPRPMPRISSARDSRSASVRAASATSAPASAYAFAMLRPMPFPAPVTTATFPSSRKRSRIIGTSIASR